MTLLPDSATFEEKVQACFVTFRRRGVSLSAIDVELLERWSSHHVPFEVIARGIRKAAEAHLWDAVDASSGPESLRSCKREVEAEIKKYQRTTAGRTEKANAPDPSDFLLQRFKQLRAAVKKATRPTAPAWLDRLEAPDTFERAERLETTVVLLLLRLLPFERRRSLLREARALVEKAPHMSASAFTESLRFHRVALTRQAWAMPASW